MVEAGIVTVDVSAKDECPTPPRAASTAHTAYGYDDSQHGQQDTGLSPRPTFHGTSSGLRSNDIIPDARCKQAVVASRQITAACLHLLTHDTYHCTGHV